MTKLILKLYIVLTLLTSCGDGNNPRIRIHNNTNSIISIQIMQPDIIYNINNIPPNFVTDFYELDAEPTEIYGIPHTIENLPFNAEIGYDYNLILEPKNFYILRQLKYSMTDTYKCVLLPNNTCTPIP